MKRLTIATVGMLSISAYAQPTYVTQLQEYDTWLKGTIGSTSSKSDYDKGFIDPDTSGNVKSASSKTTGIDLTAINMFEKSRYFTPGVLISGAKVDDDGTDVSVFKVAGVVLSNINRQPTEFSIGYVGTSHADYRNSVEIEFNIGSTENDPEFYNEFGFIYKSYIEKEGVSGANSLSILNTSSFRFSDAVDLVTHIGTSFTADAEIDDVKVIDYGLEVTFGLGLDIHVDNSQTLQLSIANSLSKNDIFVSGEAVESDDTDTTINLSLINRF